MKSHTSSTTGAGRQGGMSRRDFVQTGLLGVAASVVGSALPARALAETAKPATTGGPTVWVFTSEDKAKLMEAALKVISQNGGFGDGIKRMALKVNAAWARTPEQGANTHPDLVAAFLAGVKKAGITEVVLPELSCAPAPTTFKMSGIAAAAEANGATMIDLNKQRKLFVEVAIPGGKRLTSAKVAKDFITPGTVVVNMPVAKHHSAAQLTIAMKNWMGAIEDRSFWHRNDLHQCIADFSSFMKPAWTIVDATRTLMDSGPQGPGTTKHPNQIIVSRDQVAADAVASTLFMDSPAKIGYLRIAGEMGIGVSDLSRMTILRSTV